MTGVRTETLYDWLEYQQSQPETECTLSSATNMQGVEVICVDFDTVEALQDWFPCLIGNAIMRGFSSKAIGNRLYIWKR